MKTILNYANVLGIYFLLALPLSSQALVADHIAHGRTGNPCSAEGLGACFFLLPCASSELESNVDVTDRILLELASKEEFKNNKSFQVLVSQTHQMKNKEEKLTTYFKIAGINPENKEEIVSFISAREPKNEHLTAIMQNLNLTQPQAELLYTKLTDGLVGELR